MTQKCVAAVTLHYDTAPGLWDLAAPIAWALRKMGTRIWRQEAGISGDAIAFVTDLGRIDLRGNHDTVDIAVTALASDGLVVVQLCAHIERVVGRHARPRAIMRQSPPGASRLGVPFAPFGGADEGRTTTGRGSYLH